MDASMLLKFAQKYGKEGLELIAKHPGKAAAIGGVGAVGAGLAGAKMGSDATVHAIPGEILKRLGIDKDTTEDAKKAYTDALDYGKKHPVAGGMIGMAAMKGVDPYLQRLMALLGADDGRQD